MNDLIDQALQMRADIAAGNTLPTENDAFIVYRGDSARLSDFSTGVHCCTFKPRKLLKNDGSVDARRSSAQCVCPIREQGDQREF